MAGTTINSAFAESARKWAAKPALMHKAGGAYQSISYQELAAQVEQLASGLAAFGIQKGDRVALLSENRPEWAITDLAILALGAISVPVYTTLPAPQVAYILKNSGAKAIVVSDAKQLNKALAARAEATELTGILTLDADPPQNDPLVRTWASVMEQGKQKPLGNAFQQARDAVTPDDVASIVYTSGTTGDPKGAQLTQGNFASNFDAAIEFFGKAGAVLTDQDLFMSFLPLSHVFERTTGYYLPLRVGAAIAYTESLFKVRDNMAEAKPTLMVSTPRLFEAMQEKMLDTIEKEPEKRRKLIKNALSVGREYADRKRDGSSISPILALKHAVLDKLVLAKMRDRFGGRLRFFVSGGAALGEETAGFFAGIGIPIMEGYGMTESAPVIACNPNDRPRLGTVGKPMPGLEVRIAGDGEILAKGPNVMKGYWNNPTATAEVIDNEGWLHTGDIGVLDKDGYLKITDRKKDILVLANGKNVAPQPIESALKASPFLAEVVLIGDKQNIVTALIVPVMERLRDWATKEGLKFDGNEALIALPEVKKKIKQEIDAHSGRLADFEKIKKFTLLPTAFSMEAGELTPTLKVKRKVVAQKYAAQIAEMRGETAVAA